MRRGSLLQLILIGLVAGLIGSAVAVFVPWMPTSASREAGRIDFVYWFTTWISLVVFTIVVTALAYSLINFRVKADDLEDGPPIHGHTRLEIAWTIIPLIIVVAITVVSAIVLTKDGNAGTDPLKIKVVARQFAWQFIYPGSGPESARTFTTLRVPINTHVKLEMTSLDVIHSFWVPQFRQKQDILPGVTTTIVITPDKLGAYPVVCAELCGLGHSLMRSEAIVCPQTSYAAWSKAGGTKSGGKDCGYTAGEPAPAAAPATTGGAAKSGASIFAANGCAACHTFAAANATGKIGPSLDQLKESAQKAGQPVEAYIKQSIVDPDAYITPGYHAGVMPPSFGKTIPAAQLDALVQYLEANTK